MAAFLEPRLPALGAGAVDPAVRERLAKLTVESAFAPHTLADRDAAIACLAGLWLYHDGLDEAHTLAQDLDTREGSYWHAVMHRREGDFGNAKYWFRRVGSHAIFAPLAERAAGLAQTASAGLFKTGADWDPFAFVDLCEAASRRRPDCELLCRQIQQAEWELLFEHCYRQALGSDAYQRRP